MIATCAADPSCGDGFSAIDHAHMAQALRLAARGMYTTQPNPRVGCVIAHGERIVGSGWHARAGEPHAEVFALREAGESARTATAYVTLEPCSHHGKTPPCADALVRAGIARVVAACTDPNPRVAGAGLARLGEAGIVVEAGLMHDAARELNRGFLSRIERGRPWLRLKLAMSLDGRTALADGTSQWITGAAARADVQRWRARSSAILTGSGSVLADDPRLTVRLDAPDPGAQDATAGGRAGSRPPPRTVDPVSQSASPIGGAGEGLDRLRVVLDRNLRTPASARVLDGSVPTLVFHGENALPQDDRFARVELTCAPVHANRLDLDAVLAALAARGVNELQVEAGPTLCGALFDAGLVDELLLYVAPLALGDGARGLLALPGLASIAAARRMRIVDQRSVGDDLRLLLRGV